MGAGASNATARPSAEIAERSVVPFACTPAVVWAASTVVPAATSRTTTSELQRCRRRPRRGWSRYPTRTRPGCRRTRRPGRRRPPALAFCPAEFTEIRSTAPVVRSLRKTSLFASVSSGREVGGRGREHHVAAVARDRELDVADVLRVRRRRSPPLPPRSRRRGSSCPRRGPARRVRDSDDPRGERHEAAVGGDGAPGRRGRLPCAPAEASETRVVSPGRAQRDPRAEGGDGGGGENDGRYPAHRARSSPRPRGHGNPRGSRVAGPQRREMKLMACPRSLASRAPSARQRAPAHQEGVLGAQPGADHLRPVGRHHQGDAGRLEAEHDLGHLLLVAHGPGAHVRGGADLEHHAALQRLLEQARLHRGDDPVADAIHAQVEHLAHLVDERPRVGRVDALLAGVQRDPQAGVPGALHQRGQVAVRVGRRGAGRARPADVDGDHAAIAEADGALDDGGVQLGGERAVHHQDQAGAHRILQRGPVDAVDRRHHDGVQVALAAPVALGRVEAHLVRRDPLRPVAARDHPVDRPEDPLRAALDQLGEVVDAVEAGQAVGARPDVGGRGELPVVPVRDLDALLVGELPHGGGVDAATEVRVQLRERLVGGEDRVHRHGASAPTRRPAPSARRPGTSR